METHLNLILCLHLDILLLLKGLVNVMPNFLCDVTCAQSNPKWLVGFEGPILKKWKLKASQFR